MKSAMFKDTPAKRIVDALLMLRALRIACDLATPGHPKEWQDIMEQVDAMLNSEWAQQYLRDAAKGGHEQGS